MFLEVDRVERLWSAKKSQFGERFCQKWNFFLTHPRIPALCTHSGPTGTAPTHIRPEASHARASTTVRLEIAPARNWQPGQPRLSSPGHATADGADLAGGQGRARSRVHYRSCLFCRCSSRRGTRWEHGNDTARHGRHPSSGRPSLTVAFPLLHPLHRRLPWPHGRLPRAGRHTATAVPPPPRRPTMVLRRGSEQICCAAVCAPLLFNFHSQLWFQSITSLPVCCCQTDLNLNHGKLCSKIIYNQE
jgi:hypothetical protein